MTDAELMTEPILTQLVTSGDCPISYSQLDGQLLETRKETALLNKYVAQEINRQQETANRIMAACNRVKDCINALQPRKKMLQQM